MPTMHHYTVTIETQVQVRAENPAEAATIASSASRFGQDDMNRAQGKPHMIQGDTTSKLEVINVSVRKEI